MDWSSVESSLKDPEGPYQEFKQYAFLNDTKDIAVQLISFANRYGGKIFVGVKDDGFENAFFA
jgi:predicted HTH transcriptional regulator